MRFDLVDLRLLLNVADAASITHGAARSGLALASASERIRDMEQELGASLFERQRRGVAPTAAGLALLHHAWLVTQQLEAMRGELGSFAKGLRGCACCPTPLPPGIPAAASRSWRPIRSRRRDRERPVPICAAARGRAEIGSSPTPSMRGGAETFPSPRTGAE